MELRLHTKITCWQEAVTIFKGAAMHLNPNIYAKMFSVHTLEHHTCSCIETEVKFSLLLLLTTLIFVFISRGPLLLFILFLVTLIPS